MTDNKAPEEGLNSGKSESQAPFVWGNSYEGIVYPFFFPDETKKHLDNIKYLECSASDTFVCSYPKSGTHWVIEIVSMLKRGNSSNSDIYHFLDVVPGDHMSKVPEPRTFASHLRYDRLPDQAKTKGCKICYCLRNPKDLAVSLFTFIKRNKSMTYSGTWEEFLEDFFKGNILYSSWFEHVKSWEQVKRTENGNPILFVFYENLKENTHKEIQRIADFLGIDVDEAMIEGIIKNTTIASMREQRFTYFPHPPDILDANHMEMLFRKGEVGGWRAWFTPEQDSRMDDLLTEHMKESELNFKFHL